MGTATLSQTEKAYWVGLHAVPHVGVQTLLHLIKSLGSAERAWRASQEQLTNLVGETTAAALVQKRRTFSPKTEFDQLTQAGVTVLVRGYDRSFPAGLTEQTRCGPIVYMRGQLVPEDSESVAVVGTRRPTSYGIWVTRQLSQAIAAQKLTIVSGLAFGVDTLAHQAALQQGGRTVAVVAGDTRAPTPVSNRGVAEQIVTQSLGAIVSTFSPFKPVTPGQFVARDGVMAGLAEAVLVTEGAADSGALHTAQFARRMHKPVMAVPGPITSQLSAAPTKLLQQGATLVTGIEEILTVLGRQAETEQKARQRLAERIEQLTEPAQIAICHRLAQTQSSIDELVRELGLGAEVVGEQLTWLELAGIVARTEGKWGLVT